MQVLYQLSYGPFWYAWRRERWSFSLGSKAMPCVLGFYILVCPSSSLDQR
jgi:hypothetical protein